MNRLPSFACRTGDSAFGLGYSVSKVLKFGKLRSECLKTLAQSELAIIQPRTITHCTPLHYCTAPVGRRWDHPKARKIRQSCLFAFGHRLYCSTGGTE